jgi:hypothetical protein
MIAATFHSLHYSPPCYDFDTIEVFPSLEEVIEALFERYSVNGKQPCSAMFLDGSGSSVCYPNIEAGTYFTCYLMTEQPDDFHKLGTQDQEDWLEERRLEVHTAVHGGWRDYTVTLVESEQGALVCQVERAGI